MAANHIDNGYLILRNIRIPRENMLMKHAQVRQTIIHLCQYSTTTLEYLGRGLNYSQREYSSGHKVR